jgi:hypothetical protein
MFCKFFLFNLPWNWRLKMMAMALFTIVKLWKQPKCPITDKRIKEM